MMSDSDSDFEPSFRLLASFLKITGDILWLSKAQADGIYGWRDLNVCPRLLNNSSAIAVPSLLRLCLRLHADTQIHRSSDQSVCRERQQRRCRYPPQSVWGKIPGTLAEPERRMSNETIVAHRTTLAIISIMRHARMHLENPVRESAWDGFRCFHCSPPL